MRQIVSIRLEASVLTAARQAADKQRLTLTAFVERAVRHELEDGRRPAPEALRGIQGELKRLSDLLVGMTPEAMREAFDWGPDVGPE